MKYMKKVFVLIALCVCFITFFAITASAHDTDLGIDGYENTSYDQCSEVDYVNSTNIGDGIEEKWYELMWGKVNKNTTPNSFNTCYMYHIDDTIKTLYYQFQEQDMEQTGVTWYTTIGTTAGNMIKSSYEASMLKWNNVYFYKENNGVITKHKIVNLVNFDSLADKTGKSPHILIYPFYDSNDSVASAKWLADYEVSEETHTTNGITHKHFTKYRMKVNTFHMNKEVYLENVGAHETGHLLGLYDIDTVENPNNSNNYHHEEILMGYSKGSSSTRQREITYKDIAGVAITRGLHTNNDHKWMTDCTTTDSGIKLICSICNITKYVYSLSGIDYVILGSCNNNHTLTSNNMMAVASYENKDYYKCKYCRYVAPFSSNVTQDYSYSYVDYNFHRVTNNVQGLTYSFITPHQNETSCNLCGYYHEHSYDTYGKYSNRQHKKLCSCGDYILEYHIVAGQGMGTCVICGFPASSGGAINPFSINSINYITDNGSYISENGVIVLSDIDYLKFLSGSLDVYALADNTYKS